MAEKKETTQVQDIAPVEENKDITTPVISTTSIQTKTKKKTVATAPVKVVKPKIIKGILRSSNVFPTEYKYNGEAAFISPNGRVPNVVKDKLTFPLPNGVKFIPDN